MRHDSRGNGAPFLLVAASSWRYTEMVVIDKQEGREGGSGEGRGGREVGREGGSGEGRGREGSGKR